MTYDEEKVLGEFRTGKTNKYIVKLTSFRGEPRFDVRRYFRKENDDDWHPTKSGVSFDRGLLEFFIDVLQNRPVEVDHWLDNLSSSGVEKSRVDRERQRQSRRSNSVDDVSYSRSLEKLPGRMFFECKARGGEYELRYNRRHELGRVVWGNTDTEEEAVSVKVLDIILLSLQRSIERHTYQNGGSAQELEALFESVIVTWSQILSRALADVESGEMR